MGILVGMDEAGYGPNYGPLVVAATAWKVGEEVGGQRSGVREGKSRAAEAQLADGEGGISLASAARPNTHQVDLYRLLRNVVAKSPCERRIGIADSKILYKPGLGLRQLERGLHAVLRNIGHSLSCWSEIVDHCDADPDAQHTHLSWHDNFNCTLPIDATPDELSRLAARLARACHAADVQPIAVRARFVFPAEFNALVDHYGTKGAALSHVTIGLLRETLDALPQPSQPPIHVLCDKHGGRNFYAAILQHHFSEHWIEPVFESHAESRYEWGPTESRVQVAFRTNGESFLPTALASMTAKYLRELAMRAFNEFWCARVPNLRPTAGYPTDAPRFRKAIAPLQRELKIDDHIIWRNR